MKDPYRKFENCIFCDNPADSKEHIISKWIGKKLNPQENAITALLNQNEVKRSNRIEVVKASSPITGFTSKSVCRNCNNGWMGDAVEIAKPLLEQLIVGNYRGKLTIEQQVVLYKHFAIMACVVDVENTRSTPVLSQALRERLKANSYILPDIRVYLGKFQYCLDNPYFNTAPATVLGPLTAKAGKTITVVLGKLAIALTVGADTKKIPTGFREMRGVNAFKWPHLMEVTSKRLLTLVNKDEHGRVRLAPAV